MTDNHNYNTPKEGAADWDVALNENFSKLDTDVEVRARATDRGDYTPSDGALFRATDTGNVYIGDGSSWQQLNPPSSGSSGQSGMVDVTDLGAVGDGTTDDSEVIQQALEGYSRIYIPDQTFLINRTIELTDFHDTTVVGPGTLKLGTDPGSFMFNVRNSSGLRFSELEFDGNPQNSSDTGAFFFSECTDITIESCDIHDFGESGATQSDRHTIHATGCRDFEVNYNRIHDVSAKGVSFYGKSSHRANYSCRIVGNHVYNTGEDGLFAGTQNGENEDMLGILIADNYVDSPRANYPIRIGGGTYNGSYGQGSHVIITGNTCQNSSANAAIIGKTLDKSRYLIANNMVYGNSITVQASEEPVSAIVSNNFVLDISDGYHGIRLTRGCQDSMVVSNYTSNIIVTSGSNFSIMANYTYDSTGIDTSDANSVTEIGNI